MIKWVWRIHRINGSYRTSLNEIGGDHFRDKDLIYYDFNYLYVSFDGTGNGCWSIRTPEDDYGDILHEYLGKGYEFKGDVGIKIIRKQKLEKIQNEIYE